MTKFTFYTKNMVSWYKLRTQLYTLIDGWYTKIKVSPHTHTHTHTHTYIYGENSINTSIDNFLY